QSRFFEVHHGIAFEPASGTAPALGLTVNGCTFSHVGDGLYFATGPAAGSRLTAQNNLFLRISGHLAQIAGVKLTPDGPTPPWVWYDEDKKLPNGRLNPSIPVAKRYFRKTFTLPAAPNGPAVSALGADDGFVAWLNGQQIGQSVTPHFSQRVYAFDVTKQLKAGANLLAVEVNNQSEPLLTGIATAAGLTAQLTVGGQAV